MAQMILQLKAAGFETGFSSISWVYATGLPKSANMSKLIDKRAGVEREVIGKSKAQPCHTNNHIKEVELGCRDAEILQAR